jgi:hypothetical protein
MMKKLLGSMVLAFGLAAHAQAASVAGVNVPDAATVAGQKLVLNGAGLRKKAFFKVYVGALYLPSKTSSADAALANTGPNRISMNFMMDVGAGKLTDAWSEGFSGNNSAADVAKLKARIDRFNALWSDVEEGDVVELDFVPGTGTQVKIKGQVKGSIEGDDFNRAMLRIWLGPKPPSDDLKNGMLGK